MTLSINGSPRAAWLNILTTSNQTATVPMVGQSGFFRVADRAQITVTLSTVMLSGANERPAIVSPGSGLGFLALEGNSLIYRIDYQNLSSAANAAHIHGVINTTASAGVLQGLAQPIGTRGELRGSLTLSEATKTALLNGLTYVNIHTDINQGGEIRGQIAPSQFRAVLTGDAERPPVPGLGSGVGTFTLVGNQLSYSISYSNLSGPASAAHIHGRATPEESTGVLVGFVNPSGTSGTISGTLTLSPEHLAAILDGLTYANIHTSTFTGGEIRGQILPQP